MTSSVIAPRGSAFPVNGHLQGEWRDAVATLRDLRNQARAEIDRLIAFLDASDPYVVTELEHSCEDEGAQCEGGGGEEGCEDEGAEICEKEPSLGATEQINQTLWAATGFDDRESDGAETSEMFS